MNTMFRALKDLEEANPTELLMALYHHLNSQAKPNTPKSSPEYNKKLANKCWELSLIIKEVIE